MGPDPVTVTNKKEVKATRMIPTKKYKVKVVARPDADNVTVQLPQTDAKAPAN